jgi:hypothetical protein
MLANKPIRRFNHCHFHPFSTGVTIGDLCRCIDVLWCPITGQAALTRRKLQQSATGGNEFLYVSVDSSRFLSSAEQLG